MDVAHVALWTRDLKESVTFWRRYFNAEAGDIYQSARRPGFTSCFVTLPGAHAKIELMTAPWITGAPEPECVGWDHVAISLGNAAAVDTMAALCDAEGLLVSRPRTTGDGFYEAVISTPDGMRIEITA
jgi:lactoylglutathione lyase